MYRKLLEVPPGRVTTYADLAAAVGLRGGQRAIGNIMGRNPTPGIVPCHRVVRSDGRVGGYAYGPRIKEGMLSAEGLEIARGRIRDFEAIRHRFGAPRRRARRGGRDPGGGARP